MAYDKKTFFEIKGAVFNTPPNIGGCRRRVKAEQGNVEAQFNLGRIYYKGKGFFIYNIRKNCYKYT